jgi:processive 1,2-diacylglycerol beta-glucosyltransferase
MLSVGRWTFFLSVRPSFRYNSLHMARVLIPTVTAGAGHLQAAAALEEAWRTEFPADTVERVDVLDFVPRLYKKIYAEGYVKVIERAPELYGLMFKKTDSPSLMRKLMKVRRDLARHTNVKFVKHLKAFRPDVVVCPHFLPLEIMGGVKARVPGFNPMTVCVVTDFEAHALWMEPVVDLYCVAAEATKARLVARGVPSANVFATGIPVAARFATKPEVRALRRELELSDDLPTLLVLSGGFGMGPVAEILEELNKLERPVQVIVVAGRNEKLRKQLAACNHRHPTRVLGFATNMHELMTLADLIISKPGGLTTSEALALGRPLFILNPIPGQEAANSDFLLENGAAAKANRVEDLPYRLEDLLGSKKLTTMARAAKSLGRPEAARDICRAVVKRMEAR